MKKWIFPLLLFAAFFVVGCQEETYQLCPDNVTRVTDLTNCPVPTPTCPSCDDENSCTRGTCNAETGYKCKYEDIIPCAGNGVCERGEFPNSADCPSCDDGNTCTEDSFDFRTKSCLHSRISQCCGDSICESGESHISCPGDCEQLIDVVVTRYETRPRFEGAPQDLTGTPFVYLIVEFKLNNLLFDEEEELNFKKEKGFYYDPFRMRVEGADGTLYDVEYESDLLDDWLDYVILPKGNTRGAALLFIVPRSADHLRLVAYDRFGSRLDFAEIY